MSADTKTTGRARRATPTNDTPATDTTATDTTTADEAATADDTATGDAMSPGAGPADASVADVADDAGAAAEEVDESATWADAVPWLALQVGSRPSAGEVAIALPVWNLLHAAPGTTALRMAADAEAQGLALDPAAVARVLARYQRTGIVTASEDGPVVRWSPITPGAIIAAAKQAVTSAATSGLTDRAATVRAGVGAATARPAGELRSAVATHLAANTGQDFSPTELSRVLGGGSTGAISNACERLVGDRVAVRTSDRPRRYQHADTAPTDPTDTGAAADVADA